jgi:hypothetical protein
MTELQYPIGTCVYQDHYTTEQIHQFIVELESFPTRLRKEVEGITEAQWQTPYRPDGWTVHQVVHHCADSHLNALLRLKLALTTDNPTINPYPEDKWAMQADYNLSPEIALRLLDAVHPKIVAIAQALSPSDLNKTYFHPQYKREFRLSDVLCLYAWHGNHHLAHIQLVTR